VLQAVDVTKSEKTDNSANNLFMNFNPSCGFYIYTMYY